MWIKREVFQELQRTATSLKELADRYYAGLGVREAVIKQLQAREIELLQEIGTKIATESRAVAVADIWRVRVNELVIERAALLARLLPGLEIVTPIVERSPMVLPAGIDFEDMGDAAARMTGALVGEGETRVDAPVPASVKGAPMFQDPAEAEFDD